MDQQDRSAIEDLFGKLANVEREAAQPDSEAQSLIQDRIASQPTAPYFMAQTIVVQEQALEQANARIAELEGKGPRGKDSGGFLGGLLGARSREPQRCSPWSAGPNSAGATAANRGGGFLAGAAQTAVGVAGGVLLGNAVAGMFDGDDAHAAEPAHGDAGDAADEAGDEGGVFDGLFD